MRGAPDENARPARLSSDVEFADEGDPNTWNKTVLVLEVKHLRLRVREMESTEFDLKHRIAILTNKLLEYDPNCSIFLKSRTLFPEKSET